MGKEIITIGIILCIFGAALLILTNFHPLGIFYGIISVTLGLALILLNREENKIEKRKDINTKKTKK